jgi:thioredoxin-related protein
MWKTMVTLLFLAVANTCDAQEQKPIIIDSYAAAKQMMAEHNAPGLVIFTSQQCWACQRMKLDTFDPLMEELKMIYVVYVVDIDHEKTVYEQWVKFGKIEMIPAYAIAACGGQKMIAYNEGYLDRKDFIHWMNTEVRAYAKRHGIGTVKANAND